MAEQPTGYLEQLLTKAQAAEGAFPTESGKVEGAKSAATETENLTAFQRTIKQMQEIADKTVAEERAAAAQQQRIQEEQTSQQADQQQYDAVLAMINRQLAVSGRLDAVTAQIGNHSDGITASPANQAFLDGRGQKR